MARVAAPRAGYARHHPQPTRRFFRPVHLRSAGRAKPLRFNRLWICTLMVTLFSAASSRARTSSRSSRVWPSGIHTVGSGLPASTWPRNNRRICSASCSSVFSLPLLRRTGNLGRRQHVAGNLSCRQLVVQSEALARSLVGEDHPPAASCPRTLVQLLDQPPPTGRRVAQRDRLQPPDRVQSSIPSSDRANRKPP